MEKEYGLTLADKPKGKYNALIVAVSHNEYAKMNEADFENLLVHDGIIIDIKGITEKKN